MSKTKIDNKSIKEFGGNEESFEIELKDLNYKDRIEINDMIFDQDVSKNFSFWSKVVRKGTGLSDEELNKYSNAEIYAIGGKIIELMNKKK